MKYVKLFENWLNEAEEGKSEVKPFDPKKPFETLVVDISQDDIMGVDGKDVRKTLDNILAKCISKSEKTSGSVPNLTVNRYDWTDWELRGSIPTLILRSSDGSVYTVKLPQKSTDFVKDLRAGADFDETVFYVSLYEGDDWVNDKMNILAKPKTFLIFGLGPLSSKDFLLNVECTVISLDEKMSFMSKATLGSICAFATTKFENIATLSDKQAGTPQNIAKALGYEIPDNYAPKDGGIEVTTK
jgi:hypothetical protein